MVKAGNRFNVPPEILASIWRGESGSSFPNPYANGLGYGGLFGTSVVAPFGAASQVSYFPNIGQGAAALAEAYQAAEVFHNALVQTGGNIWEANSIYAVGNTSQASSDHGHAGLPTGTVPGYGGQGGYTTVPVSSPTGGGSLTAPPPRPGGDQSGVQDVAYQQVFDYKQLIPGYNLINPAENLASGAEKLWGGVTGLPGDISGIVSALSDGVKVFIWLLHPKHWAMMAEVLVGVGLLVLGFVWLGSGEADMPNVTVPVPGLGKSPGGGSVRKGAVRSAEKTAAAAAVV